MKKLIIILLLFLSLQVEAEASDRLKDIEQTCTDHGWAKITAIKITQKKPHDEFDDFCLLPNGEYYSLWFLSGEKNHKLKYLFDHYSGQNTKTELIEAFKIELQKDGYIVE